MYVKLADGTAVTLTQARYTDRQPMNLETYHVPTQDINRARALGLSFQEWTVTGEVADPGAVAWSSIAQISVDNVGWRRCYPGNLAFSSHLAGQHEYQLDLLVSPFEEGASTRYPTNGYKWGAQSVVLSQAGTGKARPVITILPPVAAYPLIQDLLSYEGSGVTFTRSAAKVHGGISYGINIPAFDNGLYLASDTASDVGKVTLPAATVRSVACQIKQTRYPSAWVIGAGAGTANLLTANQSNAETDTTGISSIGGTLTRDTASPLAGAASFKVVSSGSNDVWLYAVTTYASVTGGRWYAAQALLKCTAAAGRQVKIGISWYTAAGEAIGYSWSIAQAFPSTPTVVSFLVQAPATAAQAFLCIVLLSAVAGETIYADSLMLEAIPTTLTVWTAAKNKLTIDTANNLLKWTDDTTTVQATFPTANYMAGTVVDLLTIDGTSHAATVAAHAAGGSWTTGTGTLAAILWPELTLGPLEGSLGWLVAFDYVLTSAEYQATTQSLAPWQFNSLRIPLRYAGTHVKGSDGTLKVAGEDHSGLLGGVDVEVATTSVTLAETGGLACRWYAELARTDA